MATNADRTIEMLKAAGVERLFGMPGGGSNADLIEAAGNAGLPFSLAHSETASAFMATAQAEITGKPGACLATLGPGAASLMNGIANACLDRVPLLVLTDCLGERDAGVMRHQALPHGEMFRPVVKWSGRPGPGEFDGSLERALEEVLSLPPGPVHLDLSSEVTSSPAVGCKLRRDEQRRSLAGTSLAPETKSVGTSADAADTSNEHLPGASLAAETKASARVPTRQTRVSAPRGLEKNQLVAGGFPESVRATWAGEESDEGELASHACYPVLLVGLGARNGETASALRGICERLGIPALVTYKGKGVIPDSHPWFGGVLTNAALECNVLNRADLFVTVGLDPVELLPRPWKHPQPLLSISAWPMAPSQLPVTEELVGDVPFLLEQIAAFLPESHWDNAELRRLVEEQRQRMRPDADPGTCGLLPHRVVELAAEAYSGARATVDAGAHMFPVMTLWRAEEPSGVLISNGLSTMGFALPAAIGAALLEPSRPVVVFTGDGGLMMCTGELRTAAREKLRLRIIVFQDDSLSLIKVKQEQRGYRTDGVSIGEVNWSRVAEGFGVRAGSAADEPSLRAALQQTADHPGPVLIAAKISAETYAATIRALRG